MQYEPISKKRGQLMYSDRDRVLKSVTFEPNTGCWLWLKCTRGASPSRQYGRIGVVVGGKKKLVAAHRFSYTAFVGPIPDGMEVCHSCDVSSCVNPDHLFVGTHQDNIDDRERKGRNKIMRGEACGTSKLKADAVVAIKSMIGYGMSNTKISAITGVNKNTIKDIKHGRTWSHIPPPPKETP